MRHLEFEELCLLRLGSNRGVRLGFTPKPRRIGDPTYLLDIIQADAVGLPQRTINRQGLG